MAKTKIVLDSRGMRAVLSSTAIRAALRDEAQPMLAEFQRRAPVETGAYRDSGKIVDATTDRAVVRVVVTDRKAMLIESRLGVLARALRGKSLAIRRQKARDRAMDRRTAARENAEEW